MNPFIKASPKMMIELQSHVDFLGMKLEKVRLAA
jgi:hypothetical protein